MFSQRLNPRDLKSLPSARALEVNLEPDDQPRLTS